MCCRTGNDGLNEKVGVEIPTKDLRGPARADVALTMQN
jgi:hypothetical protein